ncbi:predicted protein [Histoplasma capsulatum H143]|uniref:Uncharacterized protein n=1 Tax=Ajellomyces capsulatus (strain H143) TaxID=544712 RepID=C6H685_AJECH|nr:predicted protein [Histoplasma capsulatum H143]
MKPPPDMEIFWSKIHGGFTAAAAAKMEAQRHATSLQHNGDESRKEGDSGEKTAETGGRIAADMVIIEARRKEEKKKKREKDRKDTGEKNKICSGTGIIQGYLSFPPPPAPWIASH